MKSPQKNVLGEELQACCMDPMTGFFRDGFCHTREDDLGMHTVCVEVSEDFLRYSKAMGNDLSTPNPDYNFPGLVEGDKWCLCASRWKQALEDGFAPPVILESTNIETLTLIDLEDLKKYSVSQKNQ